MLSSLVMVLMLQLPMKGIIEEQPVVRLTPPPPVVAVKEKIVVKKIYVMVDKFGKEHEGEDRASLIKEVTQSNANPFKMQDKNGQWWEHQDKASLEQFIYNKNIEIEYSRQPSFRTILRQDVGYAVPPQQFNCYVGTA